MNDDSYELAWMSVVAAKGWLRDAQSRLDAIRVNLKANSQPPDERVNAALSLVRRAQSEVLYADLILMKEAAE